MKRHILLRITLTPIKVLLLVLAAAFISIPCFMIGEEEVGDAVLDWITDFGNYKRR